MAEPHVISLSGPPPALKPNLSVSSSNDSGTIKLNHLPALDTPKKSVNFGPGADLLMNQNRAARSNSPKSDISLSELKSLEIPAPKFDVFALKTQLLIVGEPS